ncbi:DUF4214 domain-containing protein [Cellulomonas fengjieae]|uniref:DUF4214 domain-containing protein n=1 Tax=Cellulomonas fengjieae TaxID=2819978 RepID=A0ABS3SDL3_9CELL|nr:DUF4214 domain-containing protein [Cellulomonas fengjieae]MBO3083830.1 DUF4214 domain-containing protein [Cellulomonas fengjieae]QVI64883.1 DUF4214 domain-containing protein [Cellulomonas fengjieae]
MLLNVVVALVLTATLGVPGVGAARPEHVVVPAVGSAPTSTTVADETTVQEVDLTVTAEPQTRVDPDVAPTQTPDSAPPEEATEVDPGEDAVVADVQAGDRVVTPPVDTDAVQTIGVTWPEGAVVDGLGAQVRTQTDGEWGDWVELDPSDSYADAGTADAEHELRGGTDAIWIGDATALQLSFAATPEGGPEGMSLSLIGSPEVAPSDATVTQSASSGSAVVRSAVLATDAVAPQVILRGAWGARPQSCRPDVAANLVGAVVHHTAGPNSYSSVGAAMQQIRNDQAYHMDSRGWCDLGYNFVVDKWGNLYEGRADSLMNPVIGVHAGGFNTGTVGVSMLGDYSNVAPSGAMVASVAQIIGWRLGQYLVDPLGRMDYYTGAGENSRYTNQWVNLPRVFGHRDVAYTACPGNQGYSTLGTIRQQAAAASSAPAFGVVRPVVKQLYKDVLGREADPGGLEGWSRAMVQGMSPAQVATALATSTEYAYATVARDYDDVLGRAPDPQGLSTWTSAIMQGQMRSEDLRIWLFGSVEYYNISGETDNTYVAALYRDVLGRKAGSGDVAFWAPLVRSAGKDAVVRGFWKSGESANLRVEAAYQRFLGRSADPAGMATWPPVLLARGEGELRSQLVGSVEYRNRSVANNP